MSLGAILLGIAALAYAVGAGITARLLAGHLAFSWHMANRVQEVSYWAKEKGYWPDITPPALPLAPSGAQWAGAVLLGLLAGLIWPVAGALRLLPIERWAIGAEAQAIREKREQRIAELEHEMEIR